MQNRVKVKLDVIYTKRYSYALVLSLLFSAKIVTNKIKKKRKICFHLLFRKNRKNKMTFCRNIFSFFLSQTVCLFSANPSLAFSEIYTIIFCNPAQKWGILYFSINLHIKEQNQQVGSFKSAKRSRKDEKWVQFWLRAAKPFLIDLWKSYGEENCSNFFIRGCRWNFITPDSLERQKATKKKNERRIWSSRFSIF